MLDKMELKAVVEQFVASCIFENGFNENHKFTYDECVDLLSQVAYATQDNRIVKLDSFMFKSQFDMAFRDLVNIISMRIVYDRNFNSHRYSKIEVQKEVASASKRAREYRININGQKRAQAQGSKTSSTKKTTKKNEEKTNNKFNFEDVLSSVTPDIKYGSVFEKIFKKGTEQFEKQNKKNDNEDGTLILGSPTNNLSFLNDFLSTNKTKLHTLVDELTAKVIELIASDVDGIDILKASNVILTNMDKVHKMIDNGEKDLDKLFKSTLEDLEEYLKKEDIESLKEEFYLDEAPDYLKDLMEKIKEADEKLQNNKPKSSFEEAVAYIVKEVLGIPQDEEKHQEEEKVVVEVEQKLPTLDEINKKDMWDDCVSRFDYHLKNNGVNVKISDAKLLLKEYKKALKNDFFTDEEEAFQALLYKIKKVGLEKLLESLRKKKDSNNTPPSKDNDDKSESESKEESSTTSESNESEESDEEVEAEEPTSEEKEDGVDEESASETKDEEAEKEPETPKHFPKIEVLSPIAPIEGDDVEDPELLEEFNKNYMEGIKFVLPKQVHDATKKYLEEPEKTFDFMKSKTQAIKYLEEMASRYEEAYANSTPERMPSYLIPYLKELDKLFVKLGAELDKNSSKFTNNNLITNEVARLLKDFIRTKKSKNGYVDVFQDLCLKCKEFNKYLLTDNVK